MPEFPGGDPRRSLALLWRREKKPDRGPRPTLTIDAIVDAAIALADASGLASVSMRRLAEALGVGTMSLYRYVPGKGELLDLMVDRVIGEERARQAERRPAPEGWRARLEAHAHDGFETYRRHPWMLEVSLARPPLGPNVIGAFDAMLGAAIETGLPTREWVALTQLIGSYVAGAAQYEIGVAQVEVATGMTEEMWGKATEPFWEEYFDEEAHPSLTRTYTSGGFDEGAMAGMFEYGLARLLDGIEAHIERSNR